jgi:hypothetical protein
VDNHRAPHGRKVKNTSPCVSVLRLGTCSQKELGKLKYLAIKGKTQS